jgi:NTE family protein
MTATAAKSVEIGLVLQGGGALGAYQCGAITAVLDLMDDAATHGRPVALKVVTGVSIGAINAACVVGSHSRSDARDRLAALWDDLTLETPSFWPRDARRDLALYGLPGFYTPRTDFWAFPGWTNYYDSSPLLATLERHVDFAALNCSATAFVITAVEVIGGTLKRFANQPRKGEPAVIIRSEHVRASGSLPPALPWTEIAGMAYWDGGLIDNTPLGNAIDAFTPGDGVVRLLVVMNLYPLRARLPSNLTEVEDRVHELQLGNRTRQDNDVARRINALVETIDELAARVPAESLDPWLRARLEEANRYKVLDTITEIDMQDTGGGEGPVRQDSSDDVYGLRDFSPLTVARRRADGYALARRKLLPVFVEHALLPPEELPRAA